MSNVRTPRRFAQSCGDDRDRADEG